MDRESKPSELIRFQLQKITTGSRNFDSLLGGGLPIASITDIYGAAGTGKTQFAFQNAVMTCKTLQDSQSSPILAVFVDCTGSFRPERVVEISEARGILSNRILQSISTVSVRNVSAQMAVSTRLMNDPAFSHCRLIIVDDVTANFTAEYGNQGEIAERQAKLSLHLRGVSYACNRMGMSAILTNSVRSRGERGEGETTGEIVASLALKRIHFKRIDRDRFAELVSAPDKPKIKFDILKSGVL
jgi:DNA repair protein RadA